MVDHIGRFHLKIPMNTEQTIEMQEKIREVGEKGMVNWLRGLDDMFVAGFVLPYFYQVFPKSDKYSLEKLESRIFRTIQIQPLHSYLLMHRYMRTIQEWYKAKVKQVIIGMRPSEYADRIGNDDLSSYSVGYDFKAMDRSIPASFIHILYKMLTPIVGEHIATELGNEVANCLLVIPGQGMFYSGGGNKSGTGTTSYNTCKMAEQIHLVAHFLLQLPLPPPTRDNVDGLFYSGPDHINLAIAGDDGRIAHRDLKKLAAYIYIFNKASEMIFDGEGNGLKWAPYIAPPGIGSVFLDTVPVKVMGHTIPIQSRIGRALPRLAQEHDKDRPSCVQSLAQWVLPIVVYIADNDLYHDMPDALIWFIRQLHAENQTLPPWCVARDYLFQSNIVWAMLVRPIKM
jgi:hypothetical protein